MRGRMVLALTVALVEQGRRPWIVNGQVVGTIGPAMRLTLPPADPVADSAMVIVPEVILPIEDRKPTGRV